MVDHLTRFAFGDNWSRFLVKLNKSRVEDAVRSLEGLAGELNGKRFLDIGSGSGLFSLAAHRLGAQVVSFDYDPQSVACTMELSKRHGPWKVEQGSVLDANYMQSLGSFDVVYSWGVLHHTGDMYTALARAGDSVAPGGKLCIAIYNDQGRTSRMWLKKKRTYNRLPPLLRLPFAVAVCAPRELMSLGLATIQFRLPARLRTYREYGGRGMSYWNDLIDWVGGYPFEVAKPEQIFDFYAVRGFTLRKIKTCAGGLGCNEFVFERH